jgi:hypothetical protein
VSNGFNKKAFYKFKTFPKLAICSFWATSVRKMYYFPTSQTPPICISSLTQMAGCGFWFFKCLKLRVVACRSAKMASVNSYLAGQKATLLFRPRSKDVASSSQFDTKRV